MYYAFPFILAVIALAALAAAALWWFKRRTALQNARETFEDWSAESPDALRGLDQEAFTAAFMRAHGPRGQAAIAVVLAAALLVTPVTLIVFRWIWQVVLILAGGDPFYEEGLLLWRFALFFSVAAGWTVIAALAARHHHLRAPGSLREELIRQSAGRKS